ncbi:MAG: hypothetical protein RLZ55_28, partial [Actinomycetota bacterium]
RETEDPDDFLDALRYDLGSTEVFVFTPKGDVVALPGGSTPVDFAYAVHTEVGHRCVGARVNGRLVPLESALGNGDVVEIFTSKDESSGPSRDWLQFVKSARARTKIKAWFSKERREEAVERGKEALHKTIRKRQLPLRQLMNPEILADLAHEMRLADVTALYAEIGESRISAEAVIKRLVLQSGGVDEVKEDQSVVSRTTSRSSGDPGVVVDGEPDVWVKLARCCTPVPGDTIVGFVTRGSGVSVHRRDCINVHHLADQENRLVGVEWAPTESSVFMVNIQVEAIDRAGLLSDVTRALSEQHVNILSAAVSTNKDRIALSKFTFEMAEPHHLGALLRSVRGIEGVYDAYRV